MNDKERAGLKSLSRPSAERKADAAFYMKDTAWRKEVDDYDAANGTQIGKKFKRIFYNLPEEIPTPQQHKPPSAVEVAAAVKKYPPERLRDIFVGEVARNGDTRHNEVASKLTAEEYAQAKLAARFFKILPPEGGSTVRFNYQTSRERAAKKAAEEATAEQRQAQFVPPGITRYADGTLGLSDSVAFEAWKKEKAENTEAIAFLEAAAE